MSFAGPGQFSQPGSTLRVTLLQSNVAQDEKFVAELIPKALEWARVQLLAAKGDLVVAPETIIPLLPEQLETGYWDGLLQHYQQGRQAALIGLPLGNEVIGYTNSAAGISAGTKELPEGFYRYDKHHLVPFGEFIPDGFKWFTRMMNIPLGDFNRGPLVAPSFAVGAERVAANICYEDLFGEDLAARFTDAATAPTIFANISNIGWFGETIAVDQHLNISRLRALEFQRPMLRATNTGATVVIDHTGRVTHALAPLHARRARRRSAGPHRPHAVRALGRAGRRVAADAAGARCAGSVRAPQRPARTSRPGRAAVISPSRCTACPATQVPR